jgi:hypothetical protein
LLPYDVIFLETLERVTKNLEKGVEVEKTSKDAQDKLEAQSNSISSLSRPSRPACSKIDA